MKRFDIILTISIVIIAVAFIGFNQYKSNLIKKNGKEVWAEIYVKGELYKVVPLIDEEQEIIIETDLGINVIKAHDKGIEIVQADCNDHICEKTGFIKKVGEIIVCLPNKIVVEIKGNTKEAIDGLSN